MRALRKLVLALVILIPAFVLFCQWLTVRAGAKRTYDSVGPLPARKVGLVLGTNPLLSGGEPNAFFEARLDAAAELYHARKIEHLLLSGANHHHDYNEPAVMKAGLLRRGVPEGALTLDYAGFRTLDSVIRADKVFGFRRFTIISQKFHNERALLIAQHAGLDAIAFNAPGVAIRRGAKVYGREMFARVRAVLDIYVFGFAPISLAHTPEIY